MSRVALLLGGTFPVLMLAASLFNILTWDIAISAISVAFSVALVSGIIENYRNRSGWSKQSTIMTASGLLSMGTMFILLGLTFTGLTTVVSGTLWLILTLQAFVYAPKRTLVSDVADEEISDLPLEYREGKRE